MSTGARSRAWGCIQPCLLCGDQGPSIFCMSILVHRLAGSCGVPSGTQGEPGLVYHHHIISLLSTRREEIDTCLLKLAFRTTIYSLWQERNTRRHHGKAQSAASMVRVIDKTIKNRVSSLHHRRPLFYSDMMPLRLQRPPQSRNSQFLYVSFKSLYSSSESINLSGL